MIRTKKDHINPAKCFKASCMKHILPWNEETTVDEVRKINILEHQMKGNQIPPDSTCLHVHKDMAAYKLMK